MISAEEIKALMAKDENGLLPCECGKSDMEVSDPRNNPARESWVHCFYCGRSSGMAMTQEDAVEAWNTRASTQALTTLQTLLNQAAEALEDAEAACSEAINYIDALRLLPAPNLQQYTRAFLKAGETLAAITTYLTKEGE